MSIIISQDGKKAQKIDQSDFNKEGYLQNYIHENPESIPVYEIEEDKMLFVVAREFGTESGPIDALAIDKDGDIYVVETKLYKNPDKRTVVAQALDYGASLWRHANFDDFIAKIDNEVNKKFKVSFENKTKEFFDIDEEQIQILVESMKRNLQNGNIKFVILMDAVEDRLKDLIVYVNQNSQFDIYAVQMEYYKFEKYEIMIPKLFGVEVKKNISVNVSNSLRRKWDEQSFFKETKKNLDNQKMEVVRKLYSFAKQESQIIWGTGMIRASFSAQFDLLGTKPLFVVESTGNLKISFAYPKQGASAEQITKMEELESLLSRAGMHVENSTNRTNFNIDDWQKRAEDIISSIKSVI